MTGEPFDQLAERAQAFVGREALPEARAADPVTAAAIRRWCDAMEERDPIHLDRTAALRAGYPGIVAPPAMLEVWTMPPYRPGGDGDKGAMPVLHLFDDAGFSGVVATNIEQRYERYLIEGDIVVTRVLVEAVSGPKKTAVGDGYFVTLGYRFYDAAGEEVGSMTFRVLKFRPAALQADTAPREAARPRPAITRDNAFFWEGLRERKLLLQRDASGKFHHPPRPIIPGLFEPEIVAASGRGTIHSHVVIHQPQLPGFGYPLPVVLVELEEGVRIVANMIDAPAESIAIGDPVDITFVEAGPDLTLPAFRPGAGRS